MTTPRPSLLDLHPVEALLALLLISAAALHRLVVDPPRPLRRPVPDLSGTITPELVDAYMPPMLRAALRRRQAIRQPQASAAPAFGVSYGALTTEERTACAAAARAAAAQVTDRLIRVRGILLQANAAPGLTVAELRTMARQRGILSAGGRPIHKARRADLLSALGL
jgi:hypothetical protein